MQVGDVAEGTAVRRAAAEDHRRADLPGQRRAAVARAVRRSRAGGAFDDDLAEPDAGTLDEGHRGARGDRVDPKGAVAAPSSERNWV